MTFYSIVCSSRREDGILCLQLFLDYLQACQWQLLTINLILVDHASQTRLAFCTSCRKHVCFALYSPLFSFPICTAIGLQWIARYCRQYFPDFSAHLSFCQDSVDRLINQDNRQHICDMTSWTDRILFHVVCVCVCLLARWVVETAIAK